MSGGKHALALWVARIGFVAVALCTRPTNARADECSDYGRAPRVTGTLAMPGADLAHVAVFDHYALVGNQDTLLVIDLTDPRAPAAGTSLGVPGPIEALVADGAYAYIAAGPAGLQVVDLSVPTAPAIVGATATSGDATAVDATGGYAYVGTNLGLRVVDVSAPAAPAVVGSVGLFATDVIVHGSLAFVGGDELRIVDVSNPSSPAIVGATSGAYEPVRLAMETNVVVGASATLGLVAFDVTTPSSPTLVGSYGGPDMAVDVDVSGSVGYVATSTEEVLLVDLSNPAAPILIDGLYVAPARTDVTVSGDYLVLTGGDAFSVMDISDVTSIITSHAETPGSAQSVAAGADRVYVLHDDGLAIFDATSPTALAPLGSLSPGLPWNALTVNGSYAYIAAADLGLDIVDVSNPAAPSIVGEVDTPGSATAVASLGVFRFVADADSGLFVADVTNPLAPIAGGGAATAGPAIHVTVAGTRAFVAEGETGVEIFDLSNPLAPASLALLDTPGEASHVALAGSLAYIADGPEGLVVADVSAPALPVIVGQVATPIWARSVLIEESHAYVADASGLYAVDIAAPTTPSIIGSVGTLGDEYAAVTNGTRLFLVSDSGLYACLPHCALVPVQLSGFQAFSSGGEVVLSWVASFDGDHAGFNLYRREEPSGDLVRLNAELLAGAQGTFTFADNEVQPLRSYLYELRGVSESGEESVLGVLSVHTPLWGDLVTAFDVLGANPASRSIGLRLVLAAPTDVRVSVLDASGRLVRTLSDGPAAAGVVQLSWDGKDSRGVNTPAGVYVAVLSAGPDRKARKLVLVR